MDDAAGDDAVASDGVGGDRQLTLRDISDAVAGHGWRLVVGMAQTTVRTDSLARAAEVAGRIAAGSGPTAA